MHNLTDSVNDAVGVDADHGHNILVKTNRCKFIGMSELLEGAALTVLSDNVCNSCSETVDYVVVLSGDDAACINNCLLNCFNIERLKSMHIENSDFKAVCCLK